MRTIKKNKKALAYKILDILMAVLVLLILVYFGYRAIVAAKNNKEKKNAEESLKEILAAIKELKFVGDYRAPMLLYPRGWIIRAYPKEAQLIMPDVCKYKEKDCLCICNRYDCTDQSLAVCEVVEKRIATASYVAVQEIWEVRAYRWMQNHVPFTTPDPTTPIDLAKEEYVIINRIPFTIYIRQAQNKIKIQNQRYFPEDNAEMAADLSRT